MSTNGHFFTPAIHEFLKSSFLKSAPRALPEMKLLNVFLSSSVRRYLELLISPAAYTMLPIHETVAPLVHIEGDVRPLFHQRSGVYGGASAG